MMSRKSITIILTAIVVPISLILSNTSTANNVVRPEEIKSMRQVVYDHKTYLELENMWKEYYDEYPSEYAYANWMYAARYAGNKDYSKLLGKGLKEYPDNPTMLYLKAIERHGRANDVEGLKYLEKAISIDPNFVDPWFLLVTHYMDNGDEERLDLALRKILESGAINDEVMDYNYNLLIGLEKDAIIITNGDNDTFPGWILTRILDIRPDIAIVNRSLLNSEWYPLYVIKEGVPRFIDKSELQDLRDSILKRMREEKSSPSAGGPFGDTLIVRIIESAKRAGRPVYFSKTLYHTPALKDLAENGRDMGLATLVTSSNIPYADRLRKVYAVWIDSFRTGGLESWRLKNAPRTDAGRMLTVNYASGIVSNLENLNKYAPDTRFGLFRWYVKYMEQLMTDDDRSKIAEDWCEYAGDIKEVRLWGRKQGLDCGGTKER